MVKLTEDLILMQSSDSVSISSSVASTPRQQNCSGDANSEPDNQNQSQILSPGFRKINCWGCEVDDISIVSQMPDLETVVLSSNAVYDLSPLCNCKKLTQLSLRRNNVSSLCQLLHLQNISSLKTLWLMDNPVAKEDNYRLKVIKLLPQLLKLDSRVVTDAERTEAKSLVFEVSVDSAEPADESSRENETIAVDLKVSSETVQTGQEPNINTAPKNTCAANSQSINTNSVPIIEVIEDNSESVKENGVEAACGENEREPFCAVVGSDVITITNDEEASNETPQLLEGYAERVVKTGILSATQAVRQIGMKLYSTPLPQNHMAWPSWSNLPRKGDFHSFHNGNKPTPLNVEFATRNMNKTVCAIELLLDGLNEDELNYLSQSISSRLDSFSHQN